MALGTQDGMSSGTSGDLFSCLPLCAQGCSSHSAVQEDTIREAAAAAAAHNTLSEVAAGSYPPSMLPWAYKFSLFENALGLAIYLEVACLILLNTTTVTGTPATAMLDLSNGFWMHIKV